MESKEERLLRAIFGNEPQAKAIKFSMNLDDLTVDVSIRRNKKNECQSRINFVQKSRPILYI